MTQTIPVPVWIVVLFILLITAWQIAVTFQTRYLKQLYELYAARAALSAPAEEPTT